MRAAGRLFSGKGLGIIEEKEFIPKGSVLPVNKWISFVDNPVEGGR